MVVVGCSALTSGFTFVSQEGTREAQIEDLLQTIERVMSCSQGRITYFDKSGSWLLNEYQRKSIEEPELQTTWKSQRVQNHKSEIEEEAMFPKTSFFTSFISSQKESQSYSVPALIKPTERGKQKRNKERSSMGQAQIGVPVADGETHLDCMSEKAPEDCSQKELPISPIPSLSELARQKCGVVDRERWRVSEKPYSVRVMFPNRPWHLETSNLMVEIPRERNPLRIAPARRRPRPASAVNEKTEQVVKYPTSQQELLSVVFSGLDHPLFELVDVDGEGNSKTIIPLVKKMKDGSVRSLLNGRVIQVFGDNRTYPLERAFAPRMTLYSKHSGELVMSSMNPIVILNSTCRTDPDMPNFSLIPYTGVLSVYRYYRPKSASIRVSFENEAQVPSFVFVGARDINTSLDGPVPWDYYMTSKERNRIKLNSMGEVFSSRTVCDFVCTDQFTPQNWDGGADPYSVTEFQKPNRHWSIAIGLHPERTQTQVRVKMEVIMLYTAFE